MIRLSVLLLFASAGAQAQSGQDSAHPNPVPVGTGLLWATEEYRTDHHLPPLEGARLPEHDIEVRIWYGFGLASTQLLRLERKGGRWTATHYQSRYSNGTLPLPTVLPDAAWSMRWAVALENGLLTLPRFPEARGRRVIEDGTSYIVEILEGTKYYVAEVDNPEVICTEGDQVFLAAIAPLLNRDLNCRR